MTLKQSVTDRDVTFGEKFNFPKINLRMVTGEPWTRVAIVCPSTMSHDYPRAVALSHVTAR